MTRITCLLLAALACAGCTGSLLESKAETPQIVRLAEPAIAAGGPALPAALTVARPRAPSSLDTERVAVQRPQLGFDYYAGLRWSEPAPEMLQRLLVASLAREGRFAATYAAPTRVPAEYLLDVELRHFEAVYTADGQPPTVRVEAQFTLLEQSSGRRLAAFSLASSELAVENRQAAVMAAFDRAVGELLRELAATLRAVEPPRG